MLKHSIVVGLFVMFSATLSSSRPFAATRSSECSLSRLSDRKRITEANASHKPRHNRKAAGKDERERERARAGSGDQRTPSESEKRRSNTTKNAAVDAGLPSTCYVSSQLNQLYGSLVRVKSDFSTVPGSPACSESVLIATQVGDSSFLAVRSLCAVVRAAYIRRRSPPVRCSACVVVSARVPSYRVCVSVCVPRTLQELIILCRMLEKKRQACRRVLVQLDRVYVYSTIESNEQRKVLVSPLYAVVTVFSILFNIFSACCTALVFFLSHCFSKFFAGVNP